jgi:predicted DCC family thiol-disulfide oxidoreductase YuxK
MPSFELATAQLDGDWSGAPGLTVLYDRRCPLCRRLKVWLGSQRTLVPIEFLASASREARSRYPQLDHERTTRTLTVVATDGAVYEGERAWLACAWTLPRWQPVAEHLGNRPALLAVKVLARTVDRHRERALASLYGPGCDTCGIAVAPPEGPNG